MKKSKKVTNYGKILHKKSYKIRYFFFKNTVIIFWTTAPEMSWILVIIEIVFLEIPSKPSKIPILKFLLTSVKKYVENFGKP